MAKTAEKQSKMAVVRILGHQYLVEEGQTLLVDKAEKEPEVEVLALINENDVELGTPVLTDKKVKISVLEEKVLGEKIRVFKFKAKSRYQKTKGFRPQFTKIQVEKIA